MIDAPETIDILARLAKLKEVRGLSFRELLSKLNGFLPDARKIKADKQLERWMHTERVNWPEPSAEIILAIRKYLKEESF